MMNNVEQALSIINQYDSGEITFDKHANMLDELNLSDIEIEKLNAELNKDVEPLDGDGFHTTIAIHLFQCFVIKF